MTADHNDILVSLSPNLKRFLSDPIIIFAQPMSTTPLPRQEFNLVSNSPHTWLRSSLNCLVLSSSEQSANPVKQRAVSLKETLESWFVPRAPVTEVRFSRRFLQKMFICLPGLISSYTSFVTLRRFCPLSHVATSITLRSQFQLHHFRAEFPRRGGRRRLRRLPKTLDEVSLLKFLVVFACTQCQHLSDFVFVQSEVTLVIFIDEFFHIFQTINARVFIDLLLFFLFDRHFRHEHTVRSSIELWNSVLRKTRPQSWCNRCNFVLTSSTSQYHCTLIIRQSAAM